MAKHARRPSGSELNKSIHLEEISRYAARAKKRSLEQKYANSDIEQGLSRSGDKRKSKSDRLKDSRMKTRKLEAEYGSSTASSSRTSCDLEVFPNSYTIDLNDARFNESLHAPKSKKMNGSIDSRGSSDKLRGGSLHGGSLHGGSLHEGSLHGGSLHGGSLHGGSLHGASGHSRSGHARSGHSRSGHSRSGHSRSSRSTRSATPRSTKSQRWSTPGRKAGGPERTHLSGNIMGNGNDGNTQTRKSFSKGRSSRRGRPSERQPTSVRSARPDLVRSDNGFRRFGRASRSQSMDLAPRSQHPRRLSNMSVGHAPPRSESLPPWHRASQLDPPGRRTSQLETTGRNGAKKAPRKWYVTAPTYLRPTLKQTPRTLVIIWIVIVAELVMDLVTTMISFMAMVEEAKCCNQDIDLGPVPLSVTIPFMILIVAELSFLTRAVMLSMYPRGETSLSCVKTTFGRACCFCLEWSAMELYKVMHWLILLNPFFGAVVAWMLLYQSDKRECFIVLGLEAAALILHFISIYLEGDRHSLCSIIFHSIPIIPFFVVVILILIYIQQEGVCYLVEESVFWYSGCQICEDGRPPINGRCREGSGADVRFVEIDVLNSMQGTYCSEEVSFCFFEY